MLGCSVLIVGAALQTSAYGIPQTIVRAASAVCRHGSNLKICYIRSLELSLELETV